jgi:hypothetical protein
VRYRAHEINIGRAHPLKGDKEDKVIGASFKGRSSSRAGAPGNKFVALGFDIRESDLPAPHLLASAAAQHHQRLRRGGHELHLLLPDGHGVVRPRALHPVGGRARP